MQDPIGGPIRPPPWRALAAPQDRPHRGLPGLALPAATSERLGVMSGWNLQAAEHRLDATAQLKLVETEHLADRAAPAVNASGG
jgi:hypothetical protein